MGPPTPKQRPSSLLNNRNGATVSSAINSSSNNSNSNRNVPSNLQSVSSQSRVIVEQRRRQPRHDDDDDDDDHERPAQQQSQRKGDNNNNNNSHGKENQYSHQMTVVAIFLLALLSLISGIRTTKRTITATATTTVNESQQLPSASLLPSTSSSSTQKLSSPLRRTKLNRTTSTTTSSSSSSLTSTATAAKPRLSPLYDIAKVHNESTNTGPNIDFAMKVDVNGITVTVGRNMGPAVHHAILYGLPQRMPRIPRPLFDVLGNTTCVIDDDDDNNNNNNTPDEDAKRKDFPISTSSNSVTAVVDRKSSGVLQIPHRDVGLPDAIVLGVQKCGTTALYEYLIQHPEIAETRKEPYFLDEQIDAMLLASYELSKAGRDMMVTMMMNITDDSEEQRLQQNQSDGQDDEADTIDAQQGGIHQSTIRKRYSEVLRNSMRHPLRDSGKMFVDFTPNYLFKSNRVAGRISCLVPWVKLIILLRNPIERTRSQYDMKLSYTDRKTNSYHKPVPTYAEYIENDVAALHEVGVLQDWSVVDFDTYFDSDAMKEAWRTYENSGLNAPVGMGLYALQIRPYLELPNDLLVIKSEDLKQKAKSTFARVAQFLGINSNNNNNQKNSPIVFSTKVNSARKVTGIDESTEVTLQKVFEPFNRKLADILGEEWDGVWDNGTVTKESKVLGNGLVRPKFGRHHDIAIITDDSVGKRKELRRIRPSDPARPAARRLYNEPEG
jgi:hypothetical protein